MTSFTINANTTKDSYLDPANLYNKSIVRLIELSNQVWTDYNKHDPGITFVEVLSYLLTELQYKTDIPIQNVLVDGMADSAASEKTALLKQHFPDPIDILPSAALTTNDYRKLLIDTINVNNAWITPYSIPLYFDSTDSSVSRTKRSGNTITKFDVKGGYKVKLLLENGLNQAEKKLAIQAVNSTLNANRNLCEWFDEPVIIDKQNFIVCGQIDIQAKADPILVSANIWLAIQDYLQKPIRQQLPTAPDTALDWADEQFNGPILEHGYIDPESLAMSELRTNIRLSDIISLVMSVDGVVAVREISVNPQGLKVALDNPWLIPVDPNKQAHLNAQAGSLAFFKRELPSFYEQNLAMTQYKKLLKETQQKNQERADYLTDSPVPQSFNINDYRSVQWDLPAIYGLSESGLPIDASDQRQAQVLQLRGFLAFFDQVAANFVAQTSHIRELLSLDKEHLSSYFSQLPKSIQDWQKLYGNEPQAGTKLTQLFSQQEHDLERRNRFLDFMVARFGEDMTGLTDIMLNAFEPSMRKTLNYKIDFHEAITELSRDRGLGHNFSIKNQVWNTDNISGLAFRLCRLLGISNASRRNLSDIAFDIYAEIDKTPDDEFRFRVRNKNTDKILLSSSTNYETKADAIKEMRLAIRLGMERDAYALEKTKNGKFYFNIVDPSGEVIARRIEYFATRKESQRAISEVLEYLNVNYSDEGMYIVEQCWLVPQTDQSPSLPICVNEDCEQCSDPYSYQIHVILPGYGKRLGNMDFRRYCEGVIRTEVPAHIMPKICWIDKENMALIERAYKDWLAVKHGASSVRPTQKTQALIDALGEINNLYPIEKLHDCASDKTGFVIGRTALGTLKEST